MIQGHICRGLGRDTCASDRGSFWLWRVSFGRIIRGGLESISSTDCESILQKQYMKGNLREAELIS